MSYSESEPAAEEFYDAFEECFVQFQSMLERHMDGVSSSSSTRRPKRRRPYINRDREGAHERLFLNYFAENPVYPPHFFRIRYCMRRSLFLRIVDTLGQHNPYFSQRSDALHRVGLSPLQKCTASLRLLAYGAAADSVDKYLKVARTTALECLENFCQGIIDWFGAEYLRRPTVEDLERLLAKSEERGFSRMVGSINCMH